jgi:hypothetical protein
MMRQTVLLPTIDVDNRARGRNSSVAFAQHDVAMVKTGTRTEGGAWIGSHVAERLT